MNDPALPGPLTQIVPQIGAVIAVIMFIVASISGAGGSTSALEGFANNTAGKASTNPVTTTSPAASAPASTAPSTTASPTVPPTTTTPTAPVVTVRGSTAVTNASTVINILTRGLVSVDNPKVTIRLHDAPDQQTIVITSECTKSTSILSGMKRSGEIIVTDTTVRDVPDAKQTCGDHPMNMRVDVPAPFVIFSRADGSYVLADGPGAEATGPRFRPVPATEPSR